MSRRNAIQRAAFVVLLVAWPIGVEWARRQFPDAAGASGIRSVGSLILYVAIAAALRSRVIAGLLGGVFLWRMTNATPIFEDTDRLHEWWGQLFLWSVIGLFAGSLWDGLRRLKPPEADPLGD